jgi:hypothetical protein
VALAEIEPGMARIQCLPVVSVADELPAERVLLAIIAVLIAMLVPGHAERLMNTPLTRADFSFAPRRERHAGLATDNARVVRIAH